MKTQKGGNVSGHLFGVILEDLSAWKQAIPRGSIWLVKSPLRLRHMSLYRHFGRPCRTDPGSSADGVLETLNALAPGLHELSLWGSQLALPVGVRVDSVQEGIACPIVSALLLRSRTGG
jgi:hypothetical protein